MSSADERVLFSHDVVETLGPGTAWAIGADVALPDCALSGVATLGSDSRLARVESLSAALFDPTAQLLEAFRLWSQRLRVIAVSPLWFVKGWLPDGLEVNGGTYGGRLPGIEHDVTPANAPKPTSRMVAPGAVYFSEPSVGNRLPRPMPSRCGSRRSAHARARGLGGWCRACAMGDGLCDCRGE